MFSATQYGDCCWFGLIFAQIWYTTSNPDNVEITPSNLKEPQPVVCKFGKWKPSEHKIFIATIEIFTAEKHRRGKCFSTKRWVRIAQLFNGFARKNWSILWMKNYLNKMRTELKHFFKLLWCIKIEYLSGTKESTPPSIGG